MGTLTGAGSHVQVRTDARCRVQARWEVELGSSHKSQGPEKSQLQIRRGKRIYPLVQDDNMNSRDHQPVTHMISGLTSILLPYVLECPLERLT